MAPVFICTKLLSNFFDLLQKILSVVKLTQTEIIYEILQGTQSWRTLMKSRLFVALMLLTSTAFADFSEIDLITREGVEANFTRAGRGVEMDRFSYEGNPKVQNDVMIVNSSVWAQEGIKLSWTWHSCETRIRIKSPGVFEDLGTDCQFEMD